MFKNKTLLEVIDLIKNRKVTSEQFVNYYFSQIEKNKSLNAVLEVFPDALLAAREIDARIAKGEKVGRLAGAPILLKDNMLYCRHQVSCGSQFLKNYFAEYTGTCVQKLIDEDVVIIGRCNMDEFAMGSSNENSSYGVCRNPLDQTRVPGGSSGGSAAAVAADLCAAAFGTDTGGSVREPASFCGVVGMKPTYGKNSRFGIIAYASSLDQVGAITKTVADNALLQEIVEGRDPFDQTTLLQPQTAYLEKLNPHLKGVKIGFCKEIYDLYKNNENFALYQKISDWAKSQGAQVVDISIPLISKAINIYYILSPAEAASNLGRFDGVKYTTRDQNAKSIGEIIANSRSQGFGKEVQRRIMIGNFVLSAGYGDAYYKKAKAVQQKIRQDFQSAFALCDVIFFPTSVGEAFKLGEQCDDPVKLYLEDIFTVPANIAGVPALSVPCGKGKNKLPLGLQVYAAENGEQIIYDVASYIEKNWQEGV